MPAWPALASGWGQGYATECVRALLRLGFSELGVERVVGTTYEDNAASRRVVEKAGLTLSRRFRLTAEVLEGVDTYHVPSRDLWDGDDIEYALRKTGWEQQERETV
jgi:RimJ/RimL family protein N-acetyltransferase